MSDPRLWYTLTMYHWNPAYYFGSKAAGILFISDGHFLAVLRSSEVNEPDTWGIPGGAASGDESPVETAIREAAEELVGGDRTRLPDFQVLGSTIYRDGGFTYITHVVRISSKDASSWEFTLDWENDDAAWFPFDAPPEPLHFGLKYVLEHARDLIN